jgi:hypothetical protein
MKIFKTQFEIRFSPIINFPAVYRDIVAPYLKSCEYHIVNENSNQEVITMIYTSSNYMYDLRWDRFIFISEGDRSDLIEPQGPLFVYFEILKTLVKHKNFGEIRNAILLDFLLQEYKKEFHEIAEKFVDIYFTKEVPVEFKSFDKDMAITLAFEKEKKELRVTYGPFNNETDLEKFGLSPLGKIKNETLKNLNGLLIQFVYYEPLNAVDLNIFRRFIETRRDYTSKIKLF